MSMRCYWGCHYLHTANTYDRALLRIEPVHARLSNWLGCVCICICICMGEGDRH
jgi:hypothetical protein